MRRWIKIILLVLLSIFVLLSTIPYLIPVKDNKAFSYIKPFAESELIEVEGIIMHYRKWMPTSDNIKGKVLFIHGLGGSTYSWRYNVDYLAENGYIVVAVDLPGFGYSDKSMGNDHSQKNRASVVWEVLDLIDSSLEDSIQSYNWSLVGHSMGGGTVAAMSMERPTGVYRGILVAGALFENNPSYVSKLMEVYPPLKRWGMVLFERYVDENRINNFLSSAYGRNPSDDEVIGYLEPLLYSPNNNYVIDVLSTAKNEDINKLKNTDISFHGIWGEFDSWVPLGAGMRIKGIIEGFDLKMINGAYHCPMETHYIEFNSILLEILE